MKWVRFQQEQAAQGGTLIGNGYIDGDTIRVTAQPWWELMDGGEPTVVDSVPLADVTLLNPVPRPGKIVAIGLNYMDHCIETGTQPPKQPLIFTKFTTSLTDPGSEIVWSKSLTDEVDYEVELAVVMGKRARHVSKEDALDYVLGYTVANDVSARDLQLKVDGQWVRGKSLDTFCPMGPALVTADEIPDPQALPLRAILNGKALQDSNTAQMIFDVATLISFCSQAFTLEPGDVILTGTPHGVGMGFEPPVYLQDGDEIVVEIDGIGRVANTCRVLD